MLPVGLHGRRVHHISRFTCDFANASIFMVHGILLVVHGTVLVHFGRNFSVTSQLLSHRRQLLVKTATDIARRCRFSVVLCEYGAGTLQCRLAALCAILTTLLLVTADSSVNVNTVDFGGIQCHRGLLAAHSMPLKVIHLTW